MKKYICKMCGKKVSLVHDHHVVPWRFSHDDSESNIMRLCPSCHKKADANFVSLILYGEMNVVGETCKRAHARYNKKYVSSKALSHFRLLKYTFYNDVLKYNIKTGCVTIYQAWFYDPYKYGIARTKSRACLNKAASAKGQTILTGGC